MNVTPPLPLHRVPRIAIVSGVAILVLSGVGACFNLRQFLISYLFAWLFWLGLSLGCLCVAMIHHLTGGRWGDVTRRFLEAGYSIIPLMAVLFLPIVAGLRVLYPWARGSAVMASAVMRHRANYLNAPAFVGRAVFFFLVWIVLSNLLRKWSRRQDETEDLTPTRLGRSLSGPGLVIYTLTVTFAWIDWVMSLEPDWYSTVFPIMVCGGQILCAFAFAVIMLAQCRNFPPYVSVVEEGHFHQLGNLLLTFVMFWTYVCFGQLLIIWSGNQPHEIVWYLHRIAGHWKWVAGFLALFSFFLPFFILLFRASKKNAGALRVLAIMIFVCQGVNAWWLVEPSFYPDGVHLHWLDFSVVLGLGGIWVGACVRSLKNAALLTKNDPRISYAFAHAQ